MRIRINDDCRLESPDELPMDRLYGLAARCCRERGTICAVCRRPDCLHERPSLKVFTTCVNTVREFQSWRYKRNSRGELPPGDDAYVDAENHAMDVIRDITKLETGPPASRDNAPHRNGSSAVVLVDSRRLERGVHGRALACRLAPHERPGNSPRAAAIAGECC